MFNRPLCSISALRSRCRRRSIIRHTKQGVGSLLETYNRPVLWYCRDRCEISTVDDIVDTILAPARLLVNP